MSRVPLTALLCLAVLGVAVPVHADTSLRKAASKLADALGLELQLTRAAAELRRGFAVLEQERAGLDYHAAVLDHATRENARRYDAYREAREQRQTTARARARALYKLARGGAMRLLFDETGDATRAVARGRSVRFAVERDLEELATHRRAEARAREELLLAARQWQALDAVGLVMRIEHSALAGSADVFDPALARATRKRRRLDGQASESVRRQNHKLLMLVYREATALAGLRQSKLRLQRPVVGRVVGRYGEYTDKVLKIPMHRNGVELAASRNERVKAMAPGRVALVSESPGFGTVVVLDHGEGQLSLTGRLWRVVVQTGQSVQAGDELGRAAPKTIDDGLGRTVYVELRQGDNPVDPAPSLGKRQAGLALDSAHG